MVLLDVESIKSMAPGRFFRDHKGPINSLDFHHSEDVMVTVGARREGRFRV
jgi:COMPASS component SWD2